MKLQNKVTLIIAGAWLAICLIIYADSRWVIAENYRQLELSMAQMEVRDVQRAYNRSLLTLQMYALAWSVWDEAYSFMQTKDPKFIASNFVPGTFISSNLNYFIFYTVEGKPFHGLSYDFTTNTMTNVPPSLLNYIEDNKNFVKHDGPLSKKAGILATKEGLILMSSLPVVTGDQKGPVRGALLMGYNLNDHYFLQLADTVGLDLAFIPMNEILNNNEYKSVFKRLMDNPTDNISIHDDNMAYGYIPLTDIANHTVGMIQIHIPRIIYQQGVSTALHYFIIVVVLGLFVIMLTWLLLRKFVLNKVVSISKQVQRISRGGKFNKKINTGGSDELASMVVSINSMMQMIDNSQTQLTYLATHDQLTELPNRELFYDLLTQAMTTAARGSYKVAVFYLDMDKFKLINDHYGHHIGDKLLQMIAQRLKAVIRSSDVAARQSGDEFIIFMNNVTNVADVSKFAENLLAIGDEPFIINGIDIRATFSIGISIYNGDATSPDELMRQADAAMYEAKKTIGNAYQFYDKKILV